MRKFYSLLGLCKRSGNLEAGETAAEQAVRKKNAELLILAGDASANTKKKFRNSAAYYGIAFVEAGNKVYHVSSNQLSLEDIYFILTENQKKEKNGL